MYKGKEYDKRDVVAVTMVGALTLFVLWGWRSKVAEVEQLANANAAQIAVQRARVTALKTENSDDKLGEEQTKFGSWNERLLTRDEWRQRISSLSPDWSFSEGAGRNLTGCTERHGVFTLLSSSVADWPKVVRAVELLEAHPSVAIRRIEMRSVGDWTHREFAGVRFEVVYLTKI